MSIACTSPSGVTAGVPSSRALRTAALGALGFDVFYVVHLLLQGLGPDGDTPAAVAAFNVAHRSALVASEVAVGAALLAAIVFVAALAPVVRRAGRDTLATAVAITGTLFVTLGFVSQAAETALVGAAGAGDLSAVLALNQLQGRTPVVWSITALTAAVSLSALRTGLLPKWLGVGGLAAAGVFALGSIFSVLGRTVEGSSSLFGSGLFIAWMLLLAVFLWRRPPQDRSLRRGPLLITSLLAATGGALIYLAPLAAVWRTSWPYALLFAALGIAQLGAVVRVLARPTSRRVLLAAVAGLAVLIVWLLPDPSPWIPADSVIGFTDYICAALQAIGVAGLGIVFVGPDAQAPHRPRLRRVAGAVAVAPMMLVVLVATFVGFGAASDGFAGAGFPGGTVAPRHLPAGKRSTVEYCRIDGVPLAMDIYTPPAGAATPGRGTPVAMYIHGGGLTLGDRKRSGLGAALSSHEAALFTPLLRRLNAGGYLVASIDYRLTPAAPWPAPFEDAKCAVRFLRAHAADLGIDPSRIGVWGGSAGGWLSSMLGVAGRQGGPGPYAGQSSAVQAVVDMFGATDLNDFADAPPFIRFLLWAGIGPSTATRRSASPINYITGDAPPFLILHGAQDADMAPRQSVRFAERLRAAGVPATFVEVAGTGHTLATPGQRPSAQEVTTMVTDFFTTTLG